MDLARTLESQLISCCMMIGMTVRMALVQARVSESDARQLDDDTHVLGFPDRSAAVREGLRLLHRKARDAALASDYDAFYGAAGEAPVGDVTALGDQIAVEAMTDDRSVG